MWFQNIESGATCKFKVIKVNQNLTLCIFPGKPHPENRNSSDRSFTTVLHEQLSLELPKVAKLEKTKVLDPMTCNFLLLISFLYSKCGLSL